MKHIIFTRSSAALLLAITSLPALSADADIPARGPMPFDSMDTNQDGHVSQQEFGEAHAARARVRAESQEKYQYRNMGEAPKHADIDTDKDGRVSRAEFQAHRKQRMQMRETRRQENRQRNHERMGNNRPNRSGHPGGGMGGGNR